ncbi:hypothetical protein GUJ93_ZPchr0001g29247 [Zizania palustris]|uniref:Uncharacterized protein n=1 Tax=Zizania palustris TaxID=103762 RepID=A0A8J5R9U8_ZIZPA|nr:hypothetical protein GUJ93_ZPchr0001g29247 [Zizania palustris]
MRALLCGAGPRRAGQLAVAVAVFFFVVVVVWSLAGRETGSSFLPLSPVGLRLLLYAYEVAYNFFPLAPLLCSTSARLASGQRLREGGASPSRLGVVPRPAKEAAIKAAASRCFAHHFGRPPLNSSGSSCCCVCR